LLERPIFRNNPLFTISYTSFESVCIFAIRLLIAMSLTEYYFYFGLLLTLGTESGTIFIATSNIYESLYQWSCGLRRRSAVARLLGLWFRIPSGEWMSVCCEFCVLSGSGFCEGLITCQGESYRVWCV
jgi:hypothetical protein